jgi:hypothetical protein
MNNHLDLIIFHYHLLPGGVTDVIKHALSALSGMEGIRSLKVVCGRSSNIESVQKHMDRLKARAAAPAMDIDVVPELDYASELKNPPETEDLKNLLLRRYGSKDAVWLVHNYHLGKNWIFTSALNAIAREGVQKIIYQIHDYPECARYANLKILRDHIDDSLYPDSPSLRYCVINVRDYGIMRDAGMDEARIHLLENPVPAGDNPAEEEIDRRELKRKLAACLPGEGRFHPDGELWLYPVRSIRRKNVLEGGFLCGLLDKPVNLILTLPGVSVQEKAYSDLCEKAWHRGLVSGFWGTGALPEDAGISYREMISGSDLIFSSSVQEGFGYMYLNALLWKKALLARYLDIMGGFIGLLRKGASCFYDSLLIPADRRLKEETEKAYLKRLEELGALLPPRVDESLRQELSALMQGETLEFSYLSPGAQYGLLEKSRDPVYREECRVLNAPLLKDVEELRKRPNLELKDDLYEKYGEEAYRSAFRSILDSFKSNSATLHSYGRDEKNLDAALENRFSRLEFLRLLYR